MSIRDDWPSSRKVNGPISKGTAEAAVAQHDIDKLKQDKYINDRFRLSSGQEQNRRK